ncbi:hypothetical protein KUTeg_022059 [Tegillarca granosa]|uniref:Uncharacterized protein n=1 Tax=Tegillarca granosa TaxID=220873 RepID=A0ABQ9EAP2_TEGGR|nr:hypothetical protein KUTeg_022059 [Tegillarca granosa]
MEFSGTVKLDLRTKGVKKKKKKSYGQPNGQKMENPTISSFKLLVKMEEDNLESGTSSSESLLCERFCKVARRISSLESSVSSSELSESSLSPTYSSSELSENCSKSLSSALAASLFLPLSYVSTAVSKWPKTVVLDFQTPLLVPVYTLWYVYRNTTNCTEYKIFLQKINHIMVVTIKQNNAFIKPSVYDIKKEEEKNISPTKITGLWNIMFITDITAQFITWVQQNVTVQKITETQNITKPSSENITERAHSIMQSKMSTQSNLSQQHRITNITVRRKTILSILYFRASFILTSNRASDDNTPFQFSRQWFLNIDITAWRRSLEGVPDFDIGQLKLYLTDSRNKTFDKEGMRAYKALKAFKYF